MIGKLSYAQINEIIGLLSTSNTNLRDLLSKYNDNNMVNKLLNFCNDLDIYISNLSDMVSINQDADIVVDRLKDKTNI